MRPMVALADRLLITKTDLAKVEELFRKAHKYCVIANSITAKVAMEPKVIAG